MKNSFFLFLIVGLLTVIAGLLDIKYKGLFYRQLPERLQEKLDTYFS